MSRALLVFLVVASIAATAVVVRPESARANPLTGIVAVSVGAYHTCALASVGGLECWGWNQYGQLGDGAAPNRTAPVGAVGLASGVLAISAGLLHTCAVTTGGGVKCSGLNLSGAVGDGTSSTRYTLVDVVGLGSGVASVSASGSQTCALTNGGGVKCWGFNFYGQLGDGTTTTRYTPVDVLTLGSGVAVISAGGSHTCALMSAGGVKCWGDNEFGQVGDGTTTNRNTPVDVSGLTSGVTAISAGGGHTCALTSGGGVKCWGSNTYGQVGDGTTTTRYAPVDVIGLASGVAAISAGGGYTCALTSGGGVKCWGYNLDGGLGNGTTINSSTPVDVMGLGSGIAAISVGSNGCALTIGGSVKCWGANIYGGLGDGTTTSRTIPTDVLIGPKPTPTTTSTPIPTHTPTPPPAVGGVSLDPTALPRREAAGRRIELLIAIVAAGALAMGSAAWFARRKRT